MTTLPTPFAVFAEHVYGPRRQCHAALFGQDPTDDRARPLLDSLRDAVGKALLPGGEAERHLTAAIKEMKL